MVRVNLVVMGQTATVACSRIASRAIFAFSAASILRLVFFVIIRSVYQTKRPLSNLAAGPKIGVHFNLVERFFADLTSDVIRAGSFASVNELVRDIETYLSERNTNPKPYKWKAEGAEILSKIKRARAALDKAGAA